MKTMQERLNHIANGRELSLAIEDRFTNLRIFTGKDAPGKHHPFKYHDTVYMRLDKANAYSVPLSENSILYLEKENKTIHELLKFGFKSSISNLEDILSITQRLKHRECIAW